MREVQKALKASNLTLKVYDCYRPQRAVDDFVAWSNQLQNQKMKKEFYPRVDKSILFNERYISKQSMHCLGSIVDITLVPLPVPPPS
ncbi:hypothetical protein BCY86_03035 [Pajaroellobacter abortibovis]|uniref:Uncharacterized protein n=1 Tax=Pajaroellobacter abortibovis TaxID=1882918 RepID=A0A1L6MW37_9BACT|nr:hypothetical protein BCY86_03035 [Pajaroellobacter abortibovis]